MNGDPVYICQPAYSITPTCGDARLMAKILSTEDDDMRSNIEMETGLSNLLSGSSEYFVILVADKGTY